MAVAGLPVRNGGSSARKKIDSLGFRMLISAPRRAMVQPLCALASGSTDSAPPDRSACHARYRVARFGLLRAVIAPSTVLKSDPENIPFAFAFAIPIATPGLKMICRDTYDHGKSHFDAPLASRFEEMDAVVIFDNVFVPWERIFLYGQPELCNQAFGKTNAVVHMAHQVACGKLAKAEFMTGLLCSILKATGKDKDMALKGMVSEVMMMTETVRALLYQAENEAHEDEWGNYIPLRRPLDTSRNLFPKFYPRMVEILQLLGSSSLMATPTEADFENAMADEVNQYFQVANLDAKDRVALYRLAHDVAISGFGNRQALYERFFFGPPALMNAQYFDLYDRDRVMARVDDLLDLS